MAARIGKESQTGHPAIHGRIVGADQEQQSAYSQQKKVLHFSAMLSRYMAGKSGLNTRSDAIAVATG